MSRRGWISVAALLAIILGVLGVWWWALSGDDAPVEVGGLEETADETEVEIDEWVFDEPRPPEEQPPSEGPRGPPNRDGPEWAERRRRWQERWRRRVEIVPLGESAPEIDPDVIREALRPNRPALRNCIRESGGWSAFREARRAQRAPGEGERRRQRGRVFFDVGPDGQVDRETLNLQPPMPEPYSECFLEFFGSLELEDVGDGVRIELPLGPGGRRRRFGDGGMPRGRWRERGDDRGPRGERGERGSRTETEREPSERRNAVPPAN